MVAKLTKSCGGRRTSKIISWGTYVGEISRRLATCRLIFAGFGFLMGCGCSSQTDVSAQYSRVLICKFTNDRMWKAVEIHLQRGSWGLFLCQKNYGWTLSWASDSSISIFGTKKIKKIKLKQVLEKTGKHS